MLHISFGRINHNRAYADDKIPGDDRAGDLFIKAQMPARVTRRMKRAKPPARLAFDLNQLVVFNVSVNRHRVLDPFSSVSMRSHRYTEPSFQVLSAADVIRM